MARMTENLLMVLSIFLFTIIVTEVSGHGRMMDPVGRSSRWRFGSGVPNYDDNGLYCGGNWKQWGVNKGKCGLCGDDYSLPTPRPNELGGRYGQGTIVKSYRAGEVIRAGIEITANHYGYFYFNLCNLDESKENDACYDKYKLQLADGSDKYRVKTADTGMYYVDLRLPKGVTCRHCVLRWTYVAGNNWGVCPNGTGALGCGPQEHFRSCADIKISA